MAVKKQPDSDAGTVPEGANDWFRQFLKHVELFMAETGRELSPDADDADYCLAAMQAVKLSLLDSGLDTEQILGALPTTVQPDAGTGFSCRKARGHRFTFLWSDHQPWPL